MTESQKEFARALKALGLKMDTLLAACILLQSSEDMREMEQRITDWAHSGNAVTDEAVLRILAGMVNVSACAE